MMVLLSATILLNRQQIPTHDLDSGDQGGHHMSIYLGFDVWVKVFEGLQCTAGQHEGLSIEQCPEPAMCVAVDRHGYYLGCYCLEHQPVIQPEPTVFPCSICGHEFEGHKELVCIEVARRTLGERP